jgi:hypothetical protein
LDERDMGILMSTTSLLAGLVKNSDPSMFQLCAGKVIDLLRKIHG